MYSIVMLSALSAGADVTPPPMVAPAMVAPAAAGCSGSSCYGSSCYGSSCHGSSCHGGMFRGRGGCSGYHSCNGYNCFSSGYSCQGSCYGSYIAGYSSCHGCAGSFSSGSSWGPPIGMLPYTLHGYNSGTAPVWGAGPPVVMGNLTDPNAVYGTTTNPNKPPVMTIPVAPMVKPSSDGLPMGANLKFNLPADAKLFVDGKPAPGTGSERTFFTPPLAAGQKFFYDVKAELTIDGKTVVEEKRVIVEAGANLTETFPKLVAAVNGTGAVAGK